MAEGGGTGGSLGKTVVIALLVAALTGGVIGYVAGGLAGGRPSQAPQTREFWVFTVVLPFNDSTPGFPSHDYFAPDHMVVNRGDTVTIHFFNTEEEPEDHTFTMAAPYAMDRVVSFGQTVNFTFTANSAGIFPYRCTYHQPTMSGELVVDL